jgi:hypothetical protein
MGDQVTVKKTEDCLTVLSMTHVAKGESSKKATNKDLPVGAQPAYRRDVVPTIWHWAAGHALDPFNINEDDMVKALAVIWKFVYDNSVPFKIPPIVSLVRKILVTLLFDLLMTCLRPINGFLSGATILHRQRRLQ